jgi:hypothetical protein
MKVLKTAAIVVGAISVIATLGATLAPALGISAATAGTLSTIGAVAGIASASALGPMLEEVQRPMTAWLRWLRRPGLLRAGIEP